MAVPLVIGAYELAMAGMALSTATYAYLRSPAGQKAIKGTAQAIAQGATDAVDAVGDAAKSSWDWVSSQFGEDSSPNADQMATVGSEAQAASDANATDEPKSEAQPCQACAAAAGDAGGGDDGDDGGKKGKNDGKNKKPSSPNQLNKEIQTGKAPKTVERADTPKIPHEKPHVHFKDGNALNMDGTWKHGGRSLSNAEKSWLEGNGWNIPK